VYALLTDYAFVAFFVFFGIFFVAAALIGAWFLRPSGSFGRRGPGN
jgi:hypothetical protein